MNFPRALAVLGLCLPLATAGLARASTKPAEARQRFEAAVKSRESQLQTVQGRIRVENLNSKTGRTEILVGRFWVRRPDKVAVVYDPPAAQSVVCDGRSTWFHQPEANQVTVSHAGALPVFVDFQAGFRKMLARGEVRKVEIQGGFYLVTVKREGETLRIRVDDKTLLPTEVESRLDEHQSRVVFTEVVANAEIPDSRFTFTIPEGAEVLDMDDLNS